MKNTGIKYLGIFCILTSLTQASGGRATAAELAAAAGREYRLPTGRAWVEERSADSGVMLVITSGRDFPNDGFTTRKAWKEQLAAASEERRAGIAFGARGRRPESPLPGVGVVERPSGGNAVIGDGYVAGASGGNAAGDNPFDDADSISESCTAVSGAWPVGASVNSAAARAEASVRDGDMWASREGADSPAEDAEYLAAGAEADSRGSAPSPVGSEGADEVVAEHTFERRPIHGWQELLAARQARVVAPEAKASRVLVLGGQTPHMGGEEGVARQVGGIEVSPMQLSRVPKGSDRAAGPVRAASPQLRTDDSRVPRHAPVVAAEGEEASRVRRGEATAATLANRERILAALAAERARAEAEAAREGGADGGLSDSDDPEDLVPVRRPTAATLANRASINAALEEERRRQRLLALAAAAGPRSPYARGPAPATPPESGVPGVWGAGRGGVVRGSMVPRGQYVRVRPEVVESRF